MNDEVFSNPGPFDFYPKDDGSPGLLLIHGFTGTPAEVRYLAEALSRRGIGVHAPLLEGHGTRVEDLGRTDWHDWLGTVQRKIGELRRIYKPESLFIGGLSMGALLALHEFARDPERFAGLIVMAAPFKLLSVVELALSAFRVLSVPFDVRVPKFGGPDVMDERVRDLIPSYSHHSVKAALSLRELTRKVRREDLPFLEGDILLMHGKFDVTAPSVNTDIFKNEAVKARITTRIFPRSGHLIPVDHDRDQVFESVLDYIRLCPRAPG